MDNNVQNLMNFLKNSPSAFHAVENLRQMLLAEGFAELPESKRWELKPGGSYFTTRNGSSILAFRVGTELSEPAFTLTASHSDSPCFKIKENAELRVRDKYVQLNTEGYGGMICSTWLDRPLGVAGRVLVRTKTEAGERYETRLLDFDRDLVLIPNLAIHMNRKVNDGFAFNKQIDMVPLLGSGKLDGALLTSAILTIVPLSLATMVEHIGDVCAISSTCERNYLVDPGLHRTLLGDGLATSLAALFGAPANTTYGENTGVLALSRVYDPRVDRKSVV